MKLGDPNEGSLKNNNLYNDKELIDDADLDWYDYGFRNYDPQIGRFPQLDPLTDDYPFYTPYQYSGNEPIANTDIDGLEPVPSNLANDFFKVGGKVEEKTLQSVILVGISKAAPAANAGANLFKLSARAIPLLTNIAAAHSEQSIINNQIQASINYQTSPSGRADGPTISQCCSYFVSDEQKAINSIQTSDAGYNFDGSLNFSGKLAQNKTWNNFANNIVFSPAADIAGLVVGTGELSLALREARTARALSNLFETGKIVKASELAEFANRRGWKATRTLDGPLKYSDRNGIERMTIKKGSARTLGSEGPHVEIRDASGNRIDPFGNKVTRSSIGNHTIIHYDLP